MITSFSDTAPRRDAGRLSLMMLLSVVGVLLLAIGTSSALAGVGGGIVGCDAGQHLAGDVCVADDAPVIECAAGTHLVGSECVPDVPTCPAGWHSDGGSCAEGDPECGAGTHIEGGRCEVDLPAPCAPATHRVGDLCVPYEPTCDEGYSFDGDACVADQVDDADESGSSGGSGSDSGSPDDTDGSGSGTSTDGSSSSDGGTGDTSGGISGGTSDSSGTSDSGVLPVAPGTTVAGGRATSPFLGIVGESSAADHGTLPYTGITVRNALEILVGLAFLLIGTGSIMLRRWHVADWAAWDARFTPAFDDDCF